MGPGDKTVWVDLFLPSPSDVVPGTEVFKVTREEAEGKKDDLPQFNIPVYVGVGLRVSANVYVIDFGKLIAEGPPSAISRDEAVRAAYLGAEAAGLPEADEDADEEVSGAAPARG